MRAKRTTVLDAFWDHIDRTGDCWTWTAGKDKAGYGRVRKDGGPAYAHRVAWEKTYGPIPNGMHVLHRCDNPPCVRPDHLFVGTNTDNIADRVRKGRSLSGAVSKPWAFPRGEAHWARQRVRAGNAVPAAKLTAEDVRVIRRRLQDGECVALVGKDFGVRPGTVGFIRDRKTWRWV